MANFKYKDLDGQWKSIINIKGDKGDRGPTGPRGPEGPAGTSGINYSLEENLTGGTWIDGRAIYRKTIDIGSLPNNTSKKIQTGLVHRDITCVNLYGMCRNTVGDQFTLPALRRDIDLAIGTFLTNDNCLTLETGTDRTAYSGYVIIEYVKDTN